MHSDGENIISGKKICAYLINMDGAEERLRKSDEELRNAGINYKRMPAVNGNEISFPIKEFSEISYKVLHGRRTVPPEVGCYLSHINCMNDFLESSMDYAIIFEDDITIMPEFKKILSQSIAHGNHWDILRLTTVNSGPKFKAIEIGDGHNLSISLSREKGAGGYVVNRNAAAWIASLLPMRLAYDIAFDLEFFRGRKAMFIDPPIASQRTAAETQIQINIRSYKLPRYRYLTVLPYRAFLEAARVFIRGGRLLKYKLTRSPSYTP